MVRYADDIVVGFEHRADAERFSCSLAATSAAVWAGVASEKTRLIEFGLHASAERQQRGEGKPDTFDFLGFTHICGKARKTRSVPRQAQDGAQTSDCEVAGGQGATAATLA